MKKGLLLIAVVWLSTLRIWAQPGRTTILAPNIHTVRLIVDNQIEAFPVLKLNDGKTLEVSFDDMTHEYRRYTYKVEHCDVYGNVSEDLFDNEYVNATSNEVVIEDYEPSQNTTVNYTHYSFTLPNTQMRPLLSGNYRITVSTENDEGSNVPVIQTYFAIVDRKVSIYPTCTTDTDIDHNNSHQQLSLKIDCSNLLLHDAENEVKVIVLQNRRWDNAVIGPQYTGINNNTLLWEHCHSLIFEAGNEYRKAEFLSTRYPGMHSESVSWIDPFYHYTMMTDYPRKNYLYDEDKNGLSVTRYDSNGDADYEADYVMMHFKLDMPCLPQDQQVYVYGQWAGNDLNPTCRMQYNDSEQAYTADILMKCGYYNYIYLCAKNDSARGYTQPTEGNFFQTENEYDILVYHKPTGTRYWQLVGCITPIYRNK